MCIYTQREYICSICVCMCVSIIYLYHLSTYLPITCRSLCNVSVTMMHKNCYYTWLRRWFWQQPHLTRAEQTANHTSIYKPFSLSLVLHLWPSCSAGKLWRAVNCIQNNQKPNQNSNSTMPGSVGIQVFCPLFHLIYIWIILSGDIIAIWSSYLIWPDTS